MISRIFQSLTRLAKATALLHLSATFAAAATIPTTDQVPRSLLSGVEKRDPQSIRQLRSMIFDRACDSNVVRTLTALATNKVLVPDEIDLIIHASVFCPEQGKQLLKTALAHLDLSSIRRPEVQQLVTQGVYGLEKRTNEAERLSAYWKDVNKEQITAVKKLSDGDVQKSVPAVP